MTALLVSLSIATGWETRPAHAQTPQLSPVSTTAKQIAQLKQAETSPESAEPPPENDASPASEDGSEGVDVSEIDPVSDEELTQFATVLLSLQSLQAEYREQAATIVQEQGFSLERFDQILGLLRSPQSPENADVPDVTPEESLQFEQVLVQLGAMQDTIQMQMQQAILDEGLALERFQEIATVVNNDQTLEDRVRQIMEATPSSSS